MRRRPPSANRLAELQVSEVEFPRSSERTDFGGGEEGGGLFVSTLAGGSRTYGDAVVQLNATASSGLPVSYSAEGQCSVNANTVHTTAADACTVTASQAGNASYHAAPPISHKFDVAKRPITVTADAKSKTYGDTDPALNYSVTSGSLVSGDGLSGSLTRAAGETVAASPYAIQRGTLTAGGNYDLTFVGAT